MRSWHPEVDWLGKIALLVRLKGGNPNNIASEFPCVTKVEYLSGLNDAIFNAVDCVLEGCVYPVIHPEPDRQRRTVLQQLSGRARRALL